MRKRTRVKKSLVVVIIVLVLILLLGGLFILNKNKIGRASCRERV